jgi:threonine dehydrogenase-like Zn-dependent dehydrogenase
MRAAIFRGDRVFDIISADKPEVGPREVLIEVKACGICGSDLHAYRGLSPDIKTPNHTWT